MREPYSNIRLCPHGMLLHESEDCKRCHTEKSKDRYRLAAEALAESEGVERVHCAHNALWFWQECPDCVEAFLRERFPEKEV